MDTPNVKIRSKEDFKGTYSDAGSEQVTTGNHDVFVTLPAVEHVHSIEGFTLLWLLLVYLIARVFQSFVFARVGNGSTQRALEDRKANPPRRVKSKPRAKARPKKQGS